MPQLWSASLDENLAHLGEAFGYTEDLHIQRMTLGRAELAIVYAIGMVDPAEVSRQVVGPLQLAATAGRLRERLQLEPPFPASHVTEVPNIDGVAVHLFSGSVLVLGDGVPTAWAVHVPGYAKRGTERPQTEPTSMGPQEAFTETVDDNLGLLRRTLRTPDLKVERFTLGTITKTPVYMAYIDRIAPPDVVRTVRDRIQQFDRSALLGARSLIEQIGDRPWSPFPTAQVTERTDKAAASLLEGCVVVLVDRTPRVILLPATFWDFFRASSDYHEPAYFATFSRWIRFFSFFLTFTLPSLYVALVSFNPSTIPLKLVLTIAGARALIPFPAIFEVLLLDVMMEVLREATERMPRNLGQTIGVVGGIVLGTAIVQAGLVSNIMVIIVAVSAIASFAVVSHDFAANLRLLKYVLIIPTALFGLIGFVQGLAVITLHLCSLESVGIPYMSPLAPVRLRDLKDTMVRLPYPWLRTRPQTMRAQDAVRARPIERRRRQGRRS